MGGRQTRSNCPWFFVRAIYKNIKRLYARNGVVSGPRVTSARRSSSDPAHLARVAGLVYVLHSSVALRALALANSCKIIRQRCSIAVVRHSLIIQFVEG